MRAHLNGSRWSLLAKNWAGDRSTATSDHQLDRRHTGDTGLEVYAQLATRDHPPTKIQVTGVELAAVNIARHPFHGEGNQTIKPSTN